MRRQVAGPLQGLKVLEISRLIAGPSCAQILGDLGADVVKIERKPKGDEIRHIGPGFVRDEAGGQTDLSSMFLSFNRNKRSIALDLTDDMDRETIRRLAVEADVFLENFKSGGLDKYGLGYSSLRALNPNLIYVSITGFGLDGPWADRPGTDGVLQALSGFQSLNGEPDQLPQRASISIIDICAGLYAAISVLAALRNREVLGGPGQQIDTALLDCAMYIVGSRVLDYRLTGISPQRIGNGLANSSPCQVYSCRDGEMFVQAAWDDHFVRLAEAVERPELARDGRFSKSSDRIAHAVALDRELGSIFQQFTVAELNDRLEKAGILHAPVNSIAQALDNVQVKHRKLEIVTETQGGLPAPMIASPIRLSETPVTYRRPPPELGQHRAEVLSDWLGEDCSERVSAAKKSMHSEGE